MIARVTHPCWGYPGYPGSSHRFPGSPLQKGSEKRLGVVWIPDPLARGGGARGSGIQTRLEGGGLLLFFLFFPPPNAIAVRASA